MGQWVRAPAPGPGFSPWHTGKDRKRELTPRSCPRTSPTHHANNNNNSSHNTYFKVPMQMGALTIFTEKMKTSLKL